jgi:hypothetical protein
VLATPQSCSPDSPVGGGRGRVPVPDQRRQVLPRPAGLIRKLPMQARWRFRWPGRPTAAGPRPGRALVPSKSPGPAETLDSEPGHSPTS